MGNGLQVLAGGWKRLCTSHGEAVGRARVAPYVAAAGRATAAGAGVRTMGAATAGCTRPVRLTGTTRLGLGAVLGRPPRSSSMDGGAGGETRLAVRTGCVVVTVRGVTVRGVTVRDVTVRGVTVRDVTVRDVTVREVTVRG